MAGKIRGITIEIGADASKLQTALKGIDKELNSTKSQLRDVEKLLKLDPKNTELLQQKQKLLGDQVKQTSEKLKTLKQMQAEMDAQGVDKSSAAYMALQREIISTEEYLKSAKNALSEFGSVGKQKLEVFNQKLKEARQSVKEFGDRVKDIGGKISGFGQQITTKVTAPIVGAFTLAANAASDYEENLNKISVAFGDSADEVERWANNALQQFGLSKVAATGAVSSFGALGKGIGLAEKDAAEMSTTLAGLSADLASYFNTGTDESAKALEGIFTGEAESLKKFGVVMNDTNLEQFAKEQGMVWKNMSQTEKTMLRYQFVLAKTADAQGDYARTSDGTANSMKTFKAALSDAATAIGTQLLPIITPLIQKVTEFVTKLSQLSPEQQKMIVMIGGIVAAVGPLIMILGSLVSGIGAIISAFSFLISPVGLVIAAIAALIAIGVALYKNWDEIKAKATAFWEGIKQGFELTKQDVTNSIETLKTNVSNTWQKIKEAIARPIEQAWDTVSRVVDRIKRMFDFSLSFPHIKLPHFNWTWSDLGLIRVPHISVEWYKKAYEQPYLFTSPTVVGNRGFGDGNGGEMVYGHDNLMRDIRDAIGSEPIVITVQSILDGRLVGQSTTRYQHNLARSMGV